MSLKMPDIAARDANFDGADGGNGLAAQRHQREEALRLREGIEGRREGFVKVWCTAMQVGAFGSPLDNH